MWRSMYQREVSRATNTYANAVGEAKRFFASMQESSGTATMPTMPALGQSSVVRLPPLPVPNMRMDSVSLKMPSLRIQRATTLTAFPRAPGPIIPISPGLRKAGILPSIKK